MWYHSIELEALIRFNMTLEYHILDGKVSEMLMNGQAADISHICEKTWLDWLMFCDGTHVLYSDNNLVLG